MTKAHEMSAGEYAATVALQSLNIGINHANSLGLDTFRTCGLWLSIILTEAALADADAAQDLATAFIDMNRPGATDAQQADAAARSHDATNRLQTAMARMQTTANGWQQ